MGFQCDWQLTHTDWGFKVTDSCSTLNVVSVWLTTASTEWGFSVIDNWLSLNGISKWLTTDPHWMWLQCDWQLTNTEWGFSLIDNWPTLNGVSKWLTNDSLTPSELVQSPQITSHSFINLLFVSIMNTSKMNESPKWSRLRMVDVRVTWWRALLQIRHPPYLQGISRTLNYQIHVNKPLMWSILQTILILYDLEQNSIQYATLASGLFSVYLDKSKGEVKKCYIILRSIISNKWLHLQLDTTVFAWKLRVNASRGEWYSVVGWVKFSDVMMSFMKRIRPVAFLGSLDRSGFCDRPSLSIICFWIFTSLACLLLQDGNRKWW